MAPAVSRKGVVEPYTEMTGVKPCTKAADVESYTKVIFKLTKPYAVTIAMKLSDLNYLHDTILDKIPIILTNHLMPHFQQVIFVLKL